MPSPPNNFIQLFPPELRTASIVPRWSVIWTLTRDTVATHSYFVTMYARSIARLIGWPGPYALLLYLALVHDLDETITGDIVSPVKVEILDEDRYDQYVALKMQERLPDIKAELDAMIGGFVHVPAREKEIDGAWKIINVADRLDALLFLIGEQRLGNSVVAGRIPSAESRLHSAFMELPKIQQELEAWWQCVMLPAIEAHKQEGGNGV